MQTDLKKAWLKRVDSDTASTKTRLGSDSASTRTFYRSSSSYTSDNFSESPSSAHRPYHSTYSRMQERSEPVDKNNVVWLIQLLYGFCMMLPFNLIFCCYDFFSIKVSWTWLCIMTECATLDARLPTIEHVSICHEQFIVHRSSSLHLFQRKIESLDHSHNIFHNASHHHALHSNNGQLWGTASLLVMLRSLVCVRIDLRYGSISLL